MKKLTYILTFVICILISPNISKATCDYSRQAELSKIASNVQFSINYEPVSGTETTIKYTVTITNLTNDIYLIDNEGNKVIKAGEYSLTYNRSGKITYTIYSNDDSCKKTKILTKYVNLQSYNPYSGSPQCDENPDFKYCNMWGKLDIDDDQFYKAYEEYIDNQNNEESTETTKQTLKDIILQYKTELIISGIGLIIIILIVIIRKYRR